VITKHSITLAGRTIEYTATAGWLALTDEEGKKKADVFTVSYAKDGVEDAALRPITFAFNGGPGSSSVWLHLGALGPKRVDMGAEGLGVEPPYRLLDNEGSWLDLTDLVFIDPVTTGYSRAASGESADQFHGVRQDVESVGEVIRRIVTQQERWTSPKFLCGESYGTTRAAGLVSWLQERHGMFFDGLVLVSAVLNFQTTDFAPGNDLPYVLFLPTFAATAWHHRRLDPDLQADFERTLREAEAFAEGDYARALQLGDRLDSASRASVVAKLARYSGLSESFVGACNLRVGDQRFYKELLRSERRTVGRLDSRFTGIDSDAAGAAPEYDPSYPAIQGPYTALLNDYLRRELGFESDLPYEILTDRVHPWPLDADGHYLDVSQLLREAMTKTPALRVYVACGTHDVATPYFAARYTFDHLGLDPSLRDHVRFGRFPAGHMMYIHPPSLAQLRSEVAEFYDDALAH
jgi:carboxypeptidase C (cathepsin A)